MGSDHSSHICSVGYQRMIFNDGIALQLGKNGDDLATKKKKKDHSVKLSLDQFQKQSVEPEVVDIWQQNSNKGL